MNREIKFRAWHDEGRSMCNNIEVFDGSMDGVQDDPQWHVMQFTGSKDKNGTDIYEGDIVVFPETGEHYEVRWSESKVGFVVEAKDDEKITTYYNPLFFDKCEVIGNIYETPELV